MKLCIYKQQMAQMRPHEPVKEFSAWDDAKFTAAGLLLIVGVVLVFALPFLTLAGIIEIVTGVLR